MRGGLLAWAATPGAWTADTPALRSSVFTAASSHSTIPKAFPFPCSQQVALVALTQSRGQDLPSPCFLPTATVQGLALKAGMFASTGASLPQCLLLLSLCPSHISS